MKCKRDRGRGSDQRARTGSPSEDRVDEQVVLILGTEWYRKEEIPMRVDEGREDEEPAPRSLNAQTQKQTQARKRNLSEHLSRDWFCCVTSRHAGAGNIHASLLSFSLGVLGNEKSIGLGGGAAVSPYTIERCWDGDVEALSVNAALTSWPSEADVKIERRWRGVSVVEGIMDVYG